MDYIKAKAQAIKMNEYNDCTVKAVAITTDSAYKVAHKALERQGRQPRKGTYAGQIHKAIRSLGYSVTQVKGITAKTVTTLERDPLVQDGFYVAYTSGHIVAIKSGKVEDWTEGRRHRILSVWKVEPNATRKIRKALAQSLFV